MSRLHSLCQLWILLPALLPAQSAVLSRQESDERALAPGISWKHLERSTPAGAERVDIVTVDFASGGALARLSLAPGGVWADESLAESAERLHAAASFAIEIAPSPGEPRPAPPFLLVGGETVASDPASAAGPFLRFFPEGALQLIEWPRPTSFALGIAGESVPIAINRPAGAGSLALVSGVFDGSGTAGALWTADATAAVAERSGDAISWRAPKPIDKLRLLAGEWALVDAGEAQGSRIAAPGSATLESRSPEPELADSIAPMPRWLLRAGVAPPSAPEDDADSAKPTRAALGIDPDRGRLLIAQAAGAAPGFVGLTRGALADILLAEGVRDAVAFPPGEQRLCIPSVPAGTPLDGAGTVRARLSLLVVPEGAARAEHPREVARPVAISGCLTEPATNTAKTLLDGRTGFARALDNFWQAPPARRDSGIAPSVDSPPLDIAQWVTLTWQAPATLSAVELVHVENCGFSPEFDLKTFRLSYRERPGERWRSLASIDHQRPVARERIAIDPPRAVFQLRLEVVEPNFLPGGTTARLAEIIPWTEAKSPR